MTVTGAGFAFPPSRVPDARHTSTRTSSGGAQRLQRAQHEQGTTAAPHRQRPGLAWETTMATSTTRRSTLHCLPVLSAGLIPRQRQSTPPDGAEFGGED